jgi:hypothetical protein
MSAADEVEREIFEKIISIPARTSAGLRVKAEIMLILMQRYVCVLANDTIDDIANGGVGDLEDRMALSITRDILAAVDSSKL